MTKLFLPALIGITAMALMPTGQTSQTHHPGMVLIPGGSFMMGDANGQDMEKPVHEVEVDVFYMATMKSR